MNQALRDSLTENSQVNVFAVRGRYPWSLVKNNAGQIVGLYYDGTTLHGFLRYPFLHGVDLSEIPSSTEWSQLIDNYHPKFVIADTWKGRSEADAFGIFLSAPTSQNLKKAAYFELNFTDARCGLPADQRDCTAIWQFQLALQALGGWPLTDIKFMAIAVEPFPDQDVDDDNVFPQDLDSIAQRVQLISDAVTAVQGSGLKPIIYTKKHFWERIAGDTNYFSRVLSVPLWDAHPNAQPSEIDDLYYDSSGLGPLPWEPYGGWARTRAGKQYWIDDLSFGSPTVDRDVFHASFFPD